MGHRCCTKQKVKRGLWSPEEDDKLVKHITAHGHGSWSSVPKLAGLQRCGKSCRLRWINYLRPDLKRGSFTAEEEQIIIDVHRILGNRWAQIAKHLPGRTDNEVKNFWNSCIKKKLLSQGLDPKTHNLLSSRLRNNNNKSQSDHQQPFTVFNVTNSHNFMNPPVLTLPPPPQPPPPPPPPPPPDQPMAIFPYMMSTCSSMDTTIISGFNNNNNDNVLMDESPNCMWDATAIAETFEEAPPARDNGVEMDKIDDEAVANMDVASFDLGTLTMLESTLMSAAMCRDDLTSMDDLAWNFYTSSSP